MASGAFNVISVANKISDNDECVTEQKIREQNNEMNRLQNKIYISEQRAVYLKDILQSNKLRYETEITTLRVQLQKQKDMSKLEYKKAQQTFDTEIKYHKVIIQQQQNTIRNVTQKNSGKIEEITKDITSLNSTLKSKDLEIEQLRQDILDKNEELCMYRNDIKRKNAEIHSLQMITSEPFYVYEQKRPSAINIRKVSITPGARPRSRASSQWSDSPFNSPYLYRQRTNNGSISVSSPSTQSPLIEIAHGNNEEIEHYYFPFQSVTDGNKKSDRSQSDPIKSRN